jgi:hypothetical protein
MLLAELMGINPDYEHVLLLSAVVAR